jgi:regulator of PEP synthase PpsR (kinase-PPPase family)
VTGKRIDVLSDSTGETAEKVVRAAMLQFPHSGTQIVLHTRVRTKEAARPYLEAAARDGALVVFTVVSPELREYIHTASYELKIEALDLIGSLIANLPLVLGVNPPPELDEAPQDRIVGLTIGLDQLVEIRKARLKQLGMAMDTNYGLREQVKEELEFGARIFRQHPTWPVIDVTGRAIEETAVIILESLKDRDEAAKNARAAIV